MFRTEALREVFSSIRQNKIRTLLAGFGVAWGIFILVILLGVGQGFRNGVMSLFDLFAQKSMYVYGGKTSLKYRNMKEGMEVSFDERYLRALQNRYASITAISPETAMPGVSIAYRDHSMNATVTGVDADYFRIKLLRPERGGRLLNRLDMLRRREVAVIGAGIEQMLFGRQQALGKYIDINNVSYRVIGILKGDDLFSLQERNSVYIPFGTFQQHLAAEESFNSFCMILHPNTDTRNFETEMKNFVAHKSDFDPEDPQAVFIANIEAQTSSFDSLFNGLDILVWVIGICFLLSGIVGICNIMLVIVKERTNEIGIRKAVGALPNSIIGLILFESVTITLLAGIFGIVSGIGALFLVDLGIESLTDTPIMSQTAVDVPVILFALFVLVLSGLIAGLFPAIRAVQIMPVDAIRYENRG